MRVVFNHGFNLKAVLRKDRAQFGNVQRAVMEFRAEHIAGNGALAPSVGEQKPSVGLQPFGDSRINRALKFERNVQIESNATAASNVFSGTNSKKSQ